MSGWLRNFFRIFEGNPRQRNPFSYLQRNMVKNTKENLTFQFFAFFSLFFLVLRVQYPIAQFVWSIRSFDTHIGILCDILCHMAYVVKRHKTPFYDVLWHMIYDIKCHKVCQYGYQKNRIDQTNWSMGYWTLRNKKNNEKNAKNWNVKFSFVFLTIFLCKYENGWHSKTKASKLLKFFLVDPDL